MRAADLPSPGSLSSPANRQAALARALPGTSSARRFSPKQKSAAPRKSGASASSSRPCPKPSPSELEAEGKQLRQEGFALAAEWGGRGGESGLSRGSAAARSGTGHGAEPSPRSAGSSCPRCPQFALRGPGRGGVGGGGHRRARPVASHLPGQVRRGSRHGEPCTTPGQKIGGRPGSSASGFGYRDTAAGPKYTPAEAARPLMRGSPPSRLPAAPTGRPRMSLMPCGVPRGNCVLRPPRAGALKLEGFCRA